MSEPIGDPQPKPDRRPLTDPIGVRILGLEDPHNMTREDFLGAQVLLYHGSSKPIVFSSNYDYASEGYVEEGEGGQTLGVGFYTTDSKSTAENYSQERQGSPTSTPYVLELLPYHARVLDLRSAEAPHLNAPVPQELFEKWREYFQNYLKTRTANPRNLWGTNFFISNIEDEYGQFLERANQLQKQMTLRVMLDTAPDPDLNGHNYPHPPYMKTFSDFMKAEKYDGLVYVEGGEGKKAENHNSFIFFNLDKINTFEGWRQKIQ